MCSSDLRAMIAQIRGVWRRLVPQVPFDAETADSRLAEFYKADDRATRLFGIGSGLAVLIGCVGLWGLASFNTARRTKEIGIRRALGAKRSDIISQFLAETVVLTGTGGALGMAFGWLCSPVTEGIRWLLQTWFTDVWKSLPQHLQALEPMFAAWSFFVAFGISVGIGVLFGLYPARSAARLDPIEALRHE